jgi:proteasome lid subunit RPN8/RPN11
MTWREEALAHAIEEAPRESCGLLIVLKGEKHYWPCKNLSLGKTDLFLIDPIDWARAEDTGEVVAVVHSHPHSAPDASRADLVGCEASGLPWEIVSPKTGEWNTIEPCGYKMQLIGRPWIWGVADCWTLVRDWYAEQGIDLPDWERPRTQEEFTKAPMFDKLWKEAGFRELGDDEGLKRGDALLLDFRGSLNHVAVLVEPQKILHHLYGRLSSRDTYNDVLLKCTKRRLRHASQG